MRKLISLVMLLSLLLVIAGCTTTEKGAVIGGLGGAGAGAIIGNAYSHQALAGAGIGGVAGAVAGAVIGSQMEK